MTEGSVASGQMETATDRFMNSAGFLVHGENMIRATCDRKGRLYLQESVRAKYGKTFIVVEAPGELVLLPVPDDPVKDLREWGKPLQGMSMEEIKQAIQEQAEKEVSTLGLR
jgi:hypothetical protein